MIDFKIHHKSETASTNLDALKGGHGEVYTADYQSAGRGRLDHKWESRKGENLMMSVVLSVEGMEPEKVATLPIVMGLAATKVLYSTAKLKWPNDVLVEGKKLAGILCERHGDNVIVGIGVNVNTERFSPEIEHRAISLKLLNKHEVEVNEVRDQLLSGIADYYEIWKTHGFDATLLNELKKIDFLRGKTISVRQTDDDLTPLVGLCEGIADDGSLIVSGERVYAGEAHIEGIF